MPCTPNSMPPDYPSCVQLRSEAFVQRTFHHPFDSKQHLIDVIPTIPRLMNLLINMVDG